MKQHNIDFHPNLYRITLRSNNDKKQFVEMDEGLLDLIRSSLSPSQLEIYEREKVRHVEEKLAEEEQKRLRKEYDARRADAKVADVVRAVKSRPAKVIPERPIRYSERAHKYTVTVFDADGNAMHRQWRGQLRACRNIANEQFAREDAAARAEIRITNGGKLVDIITKE